MAQRYGRALTARHCLRTAWLPVQLPAMGSQQTDAPKEVAEIALAHVNRDRVESAYQRSALVERRRQLMDGWADYLS